MDAFVVIAEFRVRPEKLADFLEAARDDAAHSVADEPGCRQFDVVQPEGEDLRGLRQPRCRLALNRKNAAVPAS
jgi:quinol monooxygenase YgiN